MTTHRAFLDLLSDHGGIIGKVSRLYADNHTDREDLAQEIAYQLWKSYPSFRGESNAATWAYRVALNTAIGGMRKRRPLLSFRESLPESTDPAPASPPDDLTELYAAIRTLPRTDRALVALFLEDYSHAEIGRVLGITENNVGVKLHRIKLKLRTLLNPTPHGTRKL